MNDLKKFIFLFNDLKFPKGLFFPNDCILESAYISYKQEFHLIPFDITLFSMSNINGETKEIITFKCNKIGYHRSEKQINIKIDNEMNLYILKLQPENLILKPYVLKNGYSKEDFPIFNGIKFLYEIKNQTIGG